MYEDLEKIEARGKRKKEKQKKEGFSLFGKKEGKEEPEPTPTVEPTPMPEPKESPALDIHEESSVHKSPAEPTPAFTETAVTSEAGEKIVYSEPESVEEQQPEEPMVITEISKSPEQPEPVIEKEPVSVLESQEPSSPPEPVDEVGSPDTTGSSETIELVESTDDVDQPEEEKDRPTLQDSEFYKRDIYAAFDTIEQRGKSLKEQRSGFFKQQERPAKAAPSTPPEVEEPVPEEVVEAPAVTEPIVESVEEPVAEITVEPEPQEATQRTETVSASSEEEKKERTLRDSQFYQRDIYAALDNIEQRGKSLKEQRSGFFKQDRPAEAAPAATKPTAEPVFESKPLAGSTREEAVQETIAEARWEPLSGRDLKKAEVELLQYKRKLDKGFRSGKLTKEQCVSMVRKKEIDLGLKPST